MVCLQLERAAVLTPMARCWGEQAVSYQKGLYTCVKLVTLDGSYGRTLWPSLLDRVGYGSRLIIG